MDEDKVLEALEYFRRHATEEQKQKAIQQLKEDCQSDVVEFRKYIQYLSKNNINQIFFT